MRGRFMQVVLAIDILSVSGVLAGIVLMLLAGERVLMAEDD